MAGISEEVAVLRGTRPATFKDLFRHAPFARLMAAMTISSLGDWVGFIAVASLVASRGHGASASYAVAGVMIARMLPSVLFGAFAGVMVDRYDRKKLMVGADLARGAMYASMPFVAPLFGIFALSFAIECLSLLWSPAKDSSLPNLVPRRQLVNANTAGIAATYGTLPLGGIIFTALVGVAYGLGREISYFSNHQHQESLALWLDAGTFAFSAFMVSRIPIRTAKRFQRFQLKTAGADIVEGVRFLGRNSLVQAMTVGIVVAFVGVGSVIAIGPVFARQTLHAGAPGWGIVVTALGIGMGVGMAAIGLVTRLVDRELVFPTAMLSAALILLGVAAMPTIWLAALLVGAMGVFVGMTWVTGYSLLQENVSDEFRGRTFASLNVMARLGLFVSLAGFPALAGLIGNHVATLFGNGVEPAGTRVALWLGGGVVVLAGLAARRGMKRHRLSRPKPLGLVPRIISSPRAGFFVAFEGVEGAGKGTQTRLAREWLESLGFEVLVTREPGGTELGEELRRLLLDPQTGAVEPKTEALLFAASRSQHVATVIRPALQEGKVVICDRYVDSSVAYQGYARGLGEQDVLALNVWATQGLFPDIVLLLHVEPETGLQRGEDSPDRMELEGGDFHAKVADAYLRIAEEHPERFVVVDASQQPDLVHEHVKRALEPLVEGYRSQIGGATKGEVPPP